MTKERAEQIRKAIEEAEGWAQVGVHFTKEEEEEIVKFWLTIPASISFYEAVRCMAEDTDLE